MVDLITKHCEREGCATRPLYGFPNGNGTVDAQCCILHREDGMVSMKRRCARYGCRKYPAYGDAATRIARFCDEHREDGMVDVSAIICETEGCAMLATHGLLWGPAMHCAQHANGDAEFANRYPSCSVEGCDDRPVQSTRANYYPTHCVAHAPTAAREVRATVCARCGLDTIIDVETRRCARCAT
jgi:hypothetical protein